jgi:hypothetical protein
MYHPRCPRNLVERIVSGEILASEMGAVRLALDWLKLYDALVQTEGQREALSEDLGKAYEIIAKYDDTDPEAHKFLRPRPPGPQPEPLNWPKLPE